ncbi:MAG: O-methyltransferase [Flavobacteriaceae bacterium]
MQDPKTSSPFPNEISEKWFQYALQHSETIPPLLMDLERVTYQKVLQPRMLSGPLQGRFLSLLSHLVKPKKVLEIGTFTGYATLCLAEGMDPKGILHTIDCNEELTYIQKEFFEKSVYIQNIKTHLGNALQIIPKLSGPFDLVFIDADKVNYDRYFELILPKMTKGGLLISDNVLWSGKVLGDPNPKDHSTKALQSYNSKLQSDPRVKSVLLPIRDGLTLSWVR